MYYDDYKAANFKMLPMYDGGIQATKRQIIFFSFLMVFSSLYPFFKGFLGVTYFFGMIIMSVVFLIMSFKSIRDIHKHAKKLFILSIIYLPVWFILIIIDILLS